MSKITVVHHSADFDGLFCREIARKFLPGAELIGWDYRDPKLPIPQEGVIYILDLSPECFDNLPQHTAHIHERLIWIDHHKTAIDKFAPAIPGYRIDGVAACRLAWIWFNNVESRFKPSMGGERAFVQKHYPFPTKQDFIDRKVAEPLAVRLAGEYDIWDKRDPNAEVFQFGLRSRELSDFDWGQMLSIERPSIDDIEKMSAIGLKDVMYPDGTVIPPVVHQLLENGKLLQTYQQRNDASTMHRSFLTEFEGLKFLTLNTPRCNSLSFASKDVPETGHDALMGFYFDGVKWNVSLYHASHRKDLDLSVIAVKYGGGGHRGACGFNTGNLPGVSTLPFISI